LPSPRAPAHHAPVEAAAELAGADAPDAWVAARQAGALEQALASMTAAAREVLLLRDVEGLSGAQTAAALSIDIAAMKSRAHLGAPAGVSGELKERLRRALHDDAAP
jgi:DNA-directed RNA polymerase specialized sigma24 family protein